MEDGAGAGGDSGGVGDSLLAAIPREGENNDTHVFQENKSLPVSYKKEEN